MNFNANSMAEIFQQQVKRYGYDLACVSYKEQGRFKDLTWSDMNRMVEGVSSYLEFLGITKGERVAIFSNNRYEWWVADLAIQSIGGVIVPIYSTNSVVEAEYVLKHSEAKVCFVGSFEQYDKINKCRVYLEALNKVITFDSINLGYDIDFQEAIQIGLTNFNRDRFMLKINNIQGEDLATIMYTSGTTGEPKGVMLSHKNIISNVEQIHSVTGMNHKDVWLSFLPLSHALEHTSGFYTPIAAGGRVAFVNDFSTIQDDLRIIRPTILISVPRLYEKIHNGILLKINQAKGMQKIIGKWCLKQAALNVENVCKNQKGVGIQGLKFAIADYLLFRKLKAALGMDRVHIYVSGGGPLSVEDSNFFIGMGLNICEGYGLTETSPVTNVNHIGYIKPGTVGRALPNTIVRISDEGEIQVKGPQIMLGYYKNETATRECMTKDGFFKTGDIGIIDADGFLVITGRIKDIIVTSGGKNVSPQNIENAIKASPFVEQITLIGDKRRFISALIIPNFENTKKWAEDKKLVYSSKEELYSMEPVEKLIQFEIEKYCTEFSRVEQVKRFKLLTTEWTQEGGELTAKQSIKRKFIEQKYSDIIESMYVE